jgi:hypothetical protein
MKIKECRGQKTVDRAMDLVIRAYWRNQKSWLWINDLYSERCHQGSESSAFCSLSRLLSVLFYREHGDTVDLSWRPQERRVHSAVLQSLKTKAFFRTSSSSGKSNPSLVFGVIPESCNGEC